MTNKLSNARRSLIRAKEAAVLRLQQLEDERREIKASLKSLDVALRALGSPGKNSKPDAGSPSSGTR